MAFGDGGRGGGRWGGGSEFDRPCPLDKMTPHKDFPETTLPEMTCTRASNEEKALLHSTVKFEDFWRTSCYHLEKDAPKRKNEDKEIERFSDRKRKTQEKREALALYLKLTSANFPAEMVQGSKQGQLSNKKLRWDRDSDEQSFGVFEKLEQTHKDGDKKAEKEGDDEDEQEEEEVERDQNSDDYYNQNIEFDDDNDDWNQEETHEDYY
uniref:DNA-directed RNA polymerase III subunit n=1 Tax=Arundo donax TaxID=35708 RepID=A0A0A9HNH8_ARUDO